MAVTRVNDMAQVRPTAARYIKLGPGGAWFDRCIQEGLIELGHGAVPHEIAAAADWSRVEQIYRDQGANPATAKGFARELRDFYSLGQDALWFTIGAGRLWWAFAEAEVQPVSDAGRGVRARKVIGRWSDEAVNGEQLDLLDLSTRLTKVAAYRQTICSVEAEAYLLRRINGEHEPAVERARQARAGLIAATGTLIQSLDWRDFELLVDLIFESSGWRRVSAVGGSGQVDTDLVLEQAATGERAFVQVKSRADAAVLADYVGRFRASGRDRLFFVCHSPVGQLPAPRASDVHLWLGDGLAEQVVKAGLFDWLVAKCK